MKNLTSPGAKAIPELGVQTKDFAGGDDVEAQTEQVMQNLGAILSAGGSSYAHVIKTTVLLADMSDFQKVNAIYGKTRFCNPNYFLAAQTHQHCSMIISLMSSAPESLTYSAAKYFQTDPPARACFAVKTLPLNARVEIEAIATV